MTIHIDAGLGGPPEAARKNALALNQSRITATSICTQRAHFEYVQNRVPDRVPTALNLGRLAHAVREDLYRDVAHETILHNAEQHRSGHDKDLDRFIDELPHLLPVWAKRLTEQGGTLIATEQDWWLTLRIEPSERQVLVLGRVDALIDLGGRIWNDELKTMAPNTDTSAFLDWRRTHPQQVTTDLALGCIYDTAYAGTSYQFLFKNPYPRRASGGKTLEERIAEWPDTLFFGYDEPAILGNIDPQTLYFRLVETYQNLNLFRPKPNHSACMTFGRPSCPYFSVCHQGESLSSSNFTDRDPDYVDEAALCPQTPKE